MLLLVCGWTVLSVTCWWRLRRRAGRSGCWMLTIRSCIACCCGYGGRRTSIRRRTVIIFCCRSVMRMGLLSMCICSWWFRLRLFGVWWSVVFCYGSRRILMICVIFSSWRRRIFWRILSIVFCSRRFIRTRGVFSWSLIFLSFFLFIILSTWRCTRISSWVSWSRTCLRWSTWFITLCFVSVLISVSWFLARAGSGRYRVLIFWFIVLSRWVRRVTLAASRGLFWASVSCWRWAGFIAWFLLLFRFSEGVVVEKVVFCIRGFLEIGGFVSYTGLYGRFVG